MLDLEQYRDERGRLPSYAWPGGYPIIYVTTDGEVVCPSCANNDGDSLPFVTDPALSESSDGSDVIVAGDVFYEGPDELCCHCGVVIESAYGDPDDHGGA